VNYRHQFHAGNFADVMKHALLVRLMRALQKKDKGFLYLDTHAGRGRYDLESAAVGDSLARKPEWPEGIGRVWARAAADLPPAIAEYLELVREFDRRAGNLAAAPRFYPGSPWIARLVARSVDRLALCEKHPAEFAALRSEFAIETRSSGNASATPSEKPARVSVHEMDGYVGVRAMLPPPERRALVLIDPPYEAQDEFALLVDTLEEGLKRFPSGVFAVWYPLTERARVEEFFTGVRDLNPPPTLACELAITGEHTPIKMKGCGLMVVNPPWEFDHEAATMLTFLADALAQAPGGSGQVKWLVREL
jgi:23S rRNA (adenine2030-N6)-methyltransferase